MSGWLCRGLALALLVLSISSSAGADEKPIVIRFSHVVSEATPKGVGATLFKQKVEERLAGRVVVEVFPRGRRFNDDTALFALLFGDLEMAAPSLAKFRAFTRKLQVFDLPFLFPDVDAVHRFQASPAGQALLDSMTERGVKGLAYWDNGMRVISADRALRKPEDMRGLTFRIEPSAVFHKQYAALGATTFPMPFKRLRDALREGLVDGYENAWSNILSKGFHRLRPHVTDLRHSFLGYMVVTSSRFWEGLPGDVRTELEAILAEVSDEVNQLAREQDDRARGIVMEAQGMQLIEPTPAEAEAWRAAMTPVWSQFEEEIGRDLVAAAKRAAAGQ